MRSAYVTSLRSAGRPGESGHHATAPRRVKRRSLEDDAKREVQRAARADERAGQLEVGARVDEQPAVLVSEAEQPELVETPADDALILTGQLVRGVDARLRTRICSNDQIPA